MRILGYISEQHSRSATRRTSYLPAYNFYECHRSAPIRATPEAILDAVAAYDMRADPLSDGLMRLRELPGKLLSLSGRPADTAPAFGLHTFTPLDRQALSLTYGLTGRFWRPDMGIIPLPDAQAFAAFTTPGVARLVLHFQLQPIGEAWQLQTETFIRCPDRATRLKMLPYWLLIRLASGAIRRRTLAALRRQLNVSR